MALGLITASEPVTVNGDSVDEITADCVPREKHTGRVTVTTHPVEDNTKIADHAVVEPDTLVLDVVLSNSPLIGKDHDAPQWRVVSKSSPNPLRRGSARKELERVGTSGDVEVGRAETKYQFLQQARKDRALLSISTTLEDYTNLLITEIDVDRTVQTGDSIHLTISFQQVETVASREAQLPEESRARPKKGAGKKPKTEATDKQDAKEQTILRSILG